jgi:beta-lactamase superfamily II metal-dependent hydrolase
VTALSDLPAGNFEIELLPARHGDAILLTWGPVDDRHHLLVDGGPARGYTQVATKMAEVASAGALDLLVLTHIDADHIEGTILLTNDAGVGIGVDEIWFNGPGQLSDELSAAQGEMFAALVGARDIPLNRAFEGRAVRIHDDEPLPVRDLHGLTLTVLGPDARSLRRLRDAWNPTLDDEGLRFATPEEALAALRRRRSLNPDDAYLAAPEEPEPSWVSELAGKPAPLDDSVPNASSIVLLAEYAGASVLLAGDATAPELTAGVRRLLAERELDHLDLTALKVPHHGSVRNVTQGLLALIPADHYLFSSDGSRFGHPDAAGVARVLEYGRPEAELVFNYRTPQTLLWDDEAVLAGSTVRYPEPGGHGVRVSLSPRPVQELS